jgi:two-component system cell cycle sensor histidine kinase/response regulator CckA
LVVCVQGTTKLAVPNVVSKLHFADGRSKVGGANEMAASAENKTKLLRANFRKVERREWWLWASAFIITLLLMAGLLSFFVTGERIYWDRHLKSAPNLIRGLVGLVFLFDLYTIYQHLLIYRIRKRLLEREELFQLISENAADMIAVVDLHGKRLFNSASYQKVLGYSPEELESSSAYEQIHPDDRERVKKSAENARYSGTGQTLDYRFRHKNGSWLMLESTSSIIHTGEGPPDKLVIVNRDVTERKRTEEALRRSEADFRSVVEHAPYGIFRATIEGRLLQVNPALQKMLGDGLKQELVGKDVGSDIFRQASEFRRLTQLLAHAEEVKDFETEWKRQDNTPIIVRCFGRRFMDEKGVPAYFQIFAEDVTEKRTLERKLGMAQKMEVVGRLSGGIAHDFNNLLGVIIGYAGVLRKTLGVNNALCEHAVEIEKAGQRAASLTKQLLAFSRQQVLTPAVLDLNALAADLQRMLPRLLGEDIEVSMELLPNLRHVKADRTQIEQVILNLAINARDAMPSGGRLRIGTANVELDQAYAWDHPGCRPGKYVLLKVSDTGTGMDAETLAHIFEPFFTTKETGKGTGLGLATVYGIVKQSNGYIWVESVPGSGSEFQVYLPEHMGELPAEELRGGPREKVSGSESILLVEDADPLRNLAQTFLTTAGFRIVPARSGEEALELAAQHRDSFDLLLTDVIMPGINGRVLAQKLLTEHPAMKVLYMSGYSETFIAGHGVLGTGMHLLNKPFTEDVLLSKVREVLNSARGSAPRSSCINTTLVATELSTAE